MIEHLVALLAVLHNVHLFQNGEVPRDGGGVSAQQIRHLTDAQIPLLQGIQNHQATFMGKGFGHPRLYFVSFKIYDILLYGNIAIYYLIVKPFANRSREYLTTYIFCSRGANIPSPLLSHHICVTAVRV